MSKIFVLIAILAHVLIVVHAQGGQNVLIDFNKTNLTSEFDTRPYYGSFIIKSYQDLLLQPFRNDSETYLTVSQNGAWMCLVTKATFRLEKDANISMAINLTSSYPADQSNVQITIIDMDSGLEHLIIEAGLTNGWKIFRNTFAKTIENAKVNQTASLFCAVQLICAIIFIRNK